MATFLVADDSAFMRMRCVSILKDLGHDAVEAADGAEAVQMYRTSNPAGVLLDITMPNKDGLTALHEILAGDPKARVAMVTAMGQQKIVMEALKAGARDFVVKPFDPERVKAAVQRLVA
jgi:two-component system chemotaxis response regulator CheY